MNILVLQQQNLQAADDTSEQMERQLSQNPADAQNLRPYGSVLIQPELCRETHAPPDPPLPAPDRSLEPVPAAAGWVTWKDSFAGERGAMGLSVLQKWMVEGRALGVSSTGVWETEHEAGSERVPGVRIHWIRTRTRASAAGQLLTRAWEVMTVGVSVLVAEPGASKLFTAALTCGETGSDVTALTNKPRPSDEPSAQPYPARGQGGEWGWTAAPGSGASWVWEGPFQSARSPPWRKRRRRKRSPEGGRDLMERERQREVLKPDWSEQRAADGPEPAGSNPVRGQESGPGPAEERSDPTQTTNKTRKLPDGESWASPSSTSC